MADNIARMPGPEREVARLLAEGYCVKCVKRRLQLQGVSADELDIVAHRTPGALEGLCLECKAERVTQAEAR
jgi:hypothetical protein